MKTKKEKVMVFALTHREEWKHGYPRGYQTLWMGSKSHTIDRTYPWRDDNLSTGALTDENFLYSEYSGLYFLWKYLQNEDPQTIIVIDHYDWFFSKKRIFRFMIKNGNHSQLGFYFGAPSCVPATAFETSGAVLDGADVEALLKRDDVHFLGEMMNFPGVLFQDEQVLLKLKAARQYGKPIDGHAPGLSGEALKTYAAAGVSTDHVARLKFYSSLDKTNVNV